MDYRNADGSIAEMCGNGVRVFVRHLLDEGLVEGPTVPVGTRAGLRTTEVLADGRVRVAMGPARVSAGDVRVTTADHRDHVATPVDVGNPHAVSFVDDPAAVDLRDAPTWRPSEAFPEGVNAEFISARGPRHLVMRVFERGSGETRSCGTGTVAAAAAWHQRHAVAGEPESSPDGGHLPGGRPGGHRRGRAGGADVPHRSGRHRGPRRARAAGRARPVTARLTGKRVATVGGTCDS